MNERDRTRLEHMLSYANEVVTFTRGKTNDDFDTDILLQRALAYSTGIIGEAASHISQEYRASVPQIPWRSVIGMRNFLIHEYFQLDFEVLWNVAITDVPKLIAQLEPLLAEASDETSKE
jgi:uncharacterized protein with HEPN domain